jgi:hypothetical protein
MRVIAILRGLLAACLPFVHARRFAAVAAVVEAVVSTGRLSVSALGRGLRCRTTPKHAIKRVDRLFANPRLRRDAQRYFASLGRTLVYGGARPIVLVDWT